LSFSLLLPANRVPFPETAAIFQPSQINIDEKGGKNNTGTPDRFGQRRVLRTGVFGETGFLVDKSRYRRLNLYIGMTEPGKLRLVIADDEQIARSGLEELYPWDELGYKISGVFRNGWETLRHIEQFGADALLTDIRMPVMDGLGLLRALREKGISTGVIFLSAYTDFEYVRQGMFLGVHDYLVKPVGFDELIRTFKNLRRTLEDQKKLPEQPAGHYFSKGIPAETFYQGKEGRSERGMEKMRQYVEAHLKNASLEAAAEAAGLSPDYASRIFHKCLGVSFANYLYRQRMRQAGVLLCRIGVRINDVADSLGYNNAKNFSRAFHRYYGVKPSDYRKSGSHGG
jgi:YesN/AraC family two-component response regulator